MNALDFRCWVLAWLMATGLLVGCGGGGGSSSTATTTSSTTTTPTPTTTTTSGTAANNVQPISVTSGPSGEFPNTVMTSVTICVPGTSTCQTIANVQVDTGSSGLRLLASAVTIALPSATSASTGNGYSECAGFADGVVWGAVAKADVQLGGEKASAVPMQLIQDNGSGAAIPASCSAQGAPEDTQALLGANGIIGVGLFQQDCGAYCADNSADMYFDCPASSSVCTSVAIPVAAQVANPAALFAQDNNGVLLQLPAVPAGGAATADGNMIFGIGTQANNVQTGAVIAVPASGATAGDFTAAFQGTSLPNSFFDSGSSGLFFDDASIATCPSSGATGDLSGFYCPGASSSLSPVAIVASISASNGVSATIDASVANAVYLFEQSNATELNAFNDLGGPAGATLPGAFDFGVPFFFGRSVFTAFEQHTTPNGSGPYFAFQAYP